MRQIIIFACTALGFFIQTSVYAFPFFSENNNQNLNAASSTSNAPNGITPPVVLSPDEFSNRVNALAQQVGNDLAQQANQTLKAPTASNVNPEPITQEPTPPPPPVTSTNPQTETPPIQENEPSSTEEQQSYSGFGTGNTNGATTPPSPSGGGWNVQYW